MYKNFYQLQSNPFNANPDPRFLYRMPQTREALAGLQYGISSRKGFIVLVGEVGTGKTTLLRYVLDSLSKERGYTSFVFNPRLDVLDFLEFVLNDFGITPSSRTKGGMLMQLNRWLIERFRSQESCVIVVDEAQNLSSELLEEIRLLTNLETSSEKLLQIVLSGQPELEAKLSEPALRQLRQRVALWCRLTALTPQETGEYIRGRLTIAGCPHTIFTEEAIQTVSQASHGIPRVINLICEHALILGYVTQERMIPAGLVEAVVSDLRLDAQSVFTG